MASSRQRPLKKKISIPVTLGLLAATLIFGAIYIADQFSALKSFEKRFLSDSTRAAKTITYTIKPFLLDNNYAFMGELVSYHATRSYRTYVSILDPDGRVLAHSARAEIGSYFKGPHAYSSENLEGGLIERYIADGKKYIDISYPIKAGDLVLGSVRIGLDTKWLDEKKHEIMRTIIFFLIAALGVNLLGLLLARKVADKITRPLQLLKETVEKAGRGDYSSKVSLKTNDEMQVLADAFNNMLDELRFSREELLEKDYVDSVFSSMSEMLFVLTPEGIIETVNRAGLEISGYESAELLGQPLGKFVEDAPADFIQGVQGTIISSESTLLSKRGQRIPVLLSISPLSCKGGMEGIVVAAKDITERKKTEEDIRNSLKEKEVLLREIYHRTKNNMQVISSLINLQASSVEDNSILQMFADARNRIQAMSLVHEKLYQSGDLSNVDSWDYIKDLVRAMARSYQPGLEMISISTDIESIPFSIDTAIPCGLIINELMSNSLKYAFTDGRKGEIRITLRRNGGEEIKLDFSDNGVGLPEGFDLRQNSSLGLKLVTNLTTKQLGGRIGIMDRRPGTEFHIEFNNRGR